MSSADRASTAWKILGSWALTTMHLVILFRELLAETGTGDVGRHWVNYVRYLSRRREWVEGSGSGVCCSGGLFPRVPFIISSHHPVQVGVLT